MKKKRPEQEKKIVNVVSIKKYSLVFGVVLTIFFLLYLLFGPKLRIFFKKNQLKNLNIILITLDTLRADFVSAYGKGRAETKNLDQVAKEGVLFETCISQTPLTLPAHTSILSGTYPMYHQVKDNGGFLVPDSLEFVSEVMQKHGYTTSAFIASFVLHNKWGINQGFNTYSDDFDLSKYKTISLGNVQKRADEILNNTKKWLTENKKKKFFTWIHLYDPHTPYDPPTPFKEKFPNHPYRGEVEYMDHHLGIFFNFLKAEGIYDKSLIIIVADHGESLGEHGEDTHGFFIYESAVRVPLIIRAPFRFPVKKVKEIVELVDLAPTILDAADLPIPGTYQGQSLLELMFGKKNRDENIGYTETYYPRLHYGWSELKALYYENSMKYILAPEQEIYDLKNDEGEKNNLYRRKINEARKIKTRINKFIIAKSQNARKPGEAGKMEKDDLQKLASLGYLTTFVNTSGKKKLPDPKGKAHVFNNMALAKKNISEKNYEKAIKILTKVIENNPHIVDGILQLGNAYNKQGMYKEALNSFYRVLEKKPDYLAAMVNIITTLIKLDRLDKGIEEVQRFLKIFPRDFTLHNELGMIYFIKKDYEKAMEVFNKSIQIESINPYAFNRIGGIYVIKNDLKNAEIFLNKALQINKTLRKLYFNLAKVEEARGNINKAMEYYKKELENYPDAFKSSYNLAEEFRKTRQYEEAIRYYLQTIRSAPNFNTPYFMIAKIYLDTKTNLKEAIKLCKKGIKKEPEDKYTVFGYFILADIYSASREQKKYQHYLLKGTQLKEMLIKNKRW